MISLPLAPRSAGVLPGVLPGRNQIGFPAKTPAERGANGKSAYTLIEVLVVAVVIVLMLGMALPVFRAITGSRSEAGASNIIASMLGRARDDAIGLQQPYGVAIIYNPSLQTSSLAEVYFPSVQVWTGAGVMVPQQGYLSYTVSTANGSYTYYYINNGSVYSNGTYTITMTSGPPSSYSASIQAGMQAVGGPPLEIVPDTDLVPLPAGVGVQTISNCNFGGSSPARRLSDGYLSFGVILFDGKGRLNAYNYGVSAASKLAQAGSLGRDYPATNTNTGYLGVPSQFGLVVYQRDAWLNQKPTLSNGYSDALYQDGIPTSSTAALQDYNNGSTPSPYSEENWLDQNATPLLIDRYTGTLIKGE